MSIEERQPSILLRALNIANSPAGLEEGGLRAILDIISEEFGVENCRIYIVDKEGDTLVMKTGNHGGYYGEDVSRYRIGSGLIGTSASRRAPVVIGDIAASSAEERSLLDEAGRYSSFAAFPLIDDSNLYGVIYLSGEKPMTFSNADKRLIHGLNQIITTILRENRSQLELERRASRELSVLYDISTAIMSTIKFDRLLNNILTAVTIGDGLGFNRGMLFMVNERNNSIEGMAGVGPDNHEEAWRIWAEHSKHGKGLLESISSHTKEVEVPSSRLNRAVRTIKLPLNAPCIVAKTVREQRSFNIKSRGDADFISPELIEKLDISAFASIPLMASGKVTGVIIVDNYFNKRPITEDDMTFLAMFAGQAGLAIENSLLYSGLNDAHRELKETHEMLVHSEKMAALGEMAANVAHEIRNPLASFGGFAKRLCKELEGHKARKYAEIMVEETVRLERLLTNVLSFSQKDRDNFENHNINDILNPIFTQMEEELNSKGIKLVKMIEHLPEIYCAPSQLKQVFINLCNNSMEAMQKGGVLTVAAHSITEKKSPYIEVSITDTGEGIPEKLLSNIFNPFFTTKDGGTGLGLPIAHNIIKNHRGVIEVINRPGKGATFTVKLPVRDENAEGKQEGI